MLCKRETMNVGKSFIYRETMNLGCCFLCVFTVLINRVSPQVTVEGVTGGFVVLPCSSTEQDHKLQEINVHWRHNDTEIVYDIINGQDTVEKQHQRYRSRAESFRVGYERGNFSIRLNNLIRVDAGKFNCFISHSSELNTVLLVISESKAENEPSLLWLYIVLPVVAAIIILSSVLFHLRKKIKPPFHPVRTDDANGKSV